MSLMMIEKLIRKSILADWLPISSEDMFSNRT